MTPRRYIGPLELKAILAVLVFPTDDPESCSSDVMIANAIEDQLDVWVDVLRIRFALMDGDFARVRRNAPGYFWAGVVPRLTAHQRLTIAAARQADDSLVQKF